MRNPRSLPIVPAALAAAALLAALALLAYLIPASAPASTAAAGTARAGTAHAETASAGVSTRTLLSSKDLWATIDVCDASDQPNTLGIRGSMPGDGRARDKMYMSFRLQYLDKTTNKWIDLEAGAAPAYVGVGGGESARQGGRSFQLEPVAGKPAFTLRGVVDFQWRRGRSVVASASRPTTASHQSLAGADPAGYSAASCLIG